METIGLQEGPEGDGVAGGGLTARIQTFSKRIVNPLALTLEDICLADIAHALACCNRFCGHVERPISVAQHSVFVSRLVDGHGPVVALQGLLHDASEAYLGDVTKWLKQTDAFAPYREAEDRAQSVIFQAFGCPVALHAAVEAADRLMVRVEAHYGYQGQWQSGHPAYPPVSPEELAVVGRWEPWAWAYAESAFVERYLQLQDGLARRGLSDEEWIRIRACARPRGA